MAYELTLSIIKPDAVSKSNIGAIIDRFEKQGLTVVAAKMLTLSQAQAESFYGIHRERPFFSSLVGFMSSGPVLVQVLAGEDAVKRNRDIMGATNPAQAENGTIRKDFAASIDHNAVHGSDSADNAKIEIDFFFQPHEIFVRS